MRNRSGLGEQDLRRRPGANNLPGALARKPGWRHPVMAMAKVIVWQFAVEQAGSEDVLVMRTDWGTYHVTGASLLRCVRRLVPQFDEVWDRERPASVDDRLKGEALFNRLWYMYRERDKGVARKRITTEHPQRSKRLRPYVERGIRVFHSGEPYVSEEV